MQLYPIMGAFQQAETTTGTDEVDIVCGNQGAVCEVLYEWTDNELFPEDQFGVGDRIDVGSVNGYVVRVTLRTTVIRDSTGTLWHVPNSEIDWVANEAQKSSRATIDIGVSYTADLDEATDVLLRAAQDIAEDPDWSEVVQRPPEVSGVEELGDDAVDIRVIVWVEAGERRRFERELRRRLKEALDAAGIEMPNRQIDVRMRDQEAVA